MVTIAAFMTHGLGSDCLRMLVEQTGIDIPLVVTYSSSADVWWDDPVAETARELDLTVVPITDERSVLEYDIDYLLSVYYPNVVGSELLRHPSKGALNLHQAELPRYRGSNVFAHAIMNARNDDHWKYGTTLHQMVESVDSGPIVDREFVDIRGDDTAKTLYERTKGASRKLFKKWVPKLANRQVFEELTPQEHFSGKRYFYNKDSLEDLFKIDTSRLATDDSSEQLAVYDQIRALEFPPFNPAYTTLNKKKIYLTTPSE